MTRKVVEGLYNKLAVYAKRHKKLQKAFDDACREQYGTRYNDCDFSVEANPDLKLQDNDKIIDTLDYGTDCLPFEEFDMMMMKAKAINEAKT